MTWKERGVVELREEFVLRALEPGAQMAGLCRDFGVSRKTGYKWLARFKARGRRGLEDLSRRPHRSPLQVAGDVVAAVVRLRVAHPTWGPRKLAARLRRDAPGAHVPTLRTIARVLARTGLRAPAPARRAPRAAVPAAPVARATAPNEEWTVDFKGWWKTGDGARAEPLTVRDAATRYILDVRLLRTTSYAAVRAVFERLFRHFGLPTRIRTDGGSPFASPRNAQGWTRLRAWWWALGIDVLRGRPGQPQDNGAHERMHRDMAAELEAHAAASWPAQQRACDAWRHEFNVVRPHAARGDAPPAATYVRSTRRYHVGVVTLAYPPGADLRTVSSAGEIRCRGCRVRISNALRGYAVGLVARDATHDTVWFGAKLLGVLAHGAAADGALRFTWNVAPDPAAGDTKST
jgi:transposase InsO family protein